jgi:uncharacterized protein (TIGR00106 family)
MAMACLVEFSMSPLDKGPSLSAYVARSLEIVADSGLAYRLTPMGTILEGEWDECMEVIRKCHQRMSADCTRISCSIKVDYRQGATGRLTSKIESVEKKLGRKLRT